MSDLTCDGSLADTVTSLSALHRELSGLDRGREQLRSAWGSDAVADAYHDFIGDWDDNRRRILTSMDSVRTMAQACLDEFAAVDAALSQAAEG